MTYIEQNVHTGEKRQHTDASLRLRLLAINVSSMPATGLPKLPLDTMHSWFRQPHSRDLPARPARDTGAWGLDTVAQACSICHGARTIQYKTADTAEHGDCWKCNGKGTIAVPV
jgi:mono/diheme cytochrome c family protein